MLTSSHALGAAGTGFERIPAITSNRVSHGPRSHDQAALSFEVTRWASVSASPMRCFAVTQERTVKTAWYMRGDLSSRRLVARLMDIICVQAAGGISIVSITTTALTRLATALAHHMMGRDEPLLWVPRRINSARLSSKEVSRLWARGAPGLFGASVTRGNRGRREPTPRS